MSLKRWVVSILELVAIVAVLSIVAGSVVGHPVLVSYVETGSMSPALAPGDGFVAVPSQLDSSVREGDVIVFEAERIRGGGLTTHRVVDRTRRGYITKGDANPFTDQADAEPPVRDAQIVAKALQVNGHVVAIPYFGTVVTGVGSGIGTIQRTLAELLGTRAVLGAHGVAYLFFVGSLLWYAFGEWRDRNRKPRQLNLSRDSGMDVRLVMAAFVAVVVIAATAAMVVPTGTEKYGIVSAEFESDRPTVIPKGDSNDVIHLVGNAGFLPVVVYLEPATEGINVSQPELSVPPRSVVNATVTLHAPPETGYYRRFLVEHRYLAILPETTIRALHRFHPWVPIVAIDALLGVPFYLAGMRLVGTGRLRSRSRAGPSVRYRLLRWLS